MRPRHGPRCPSRRGAVVRCRSAVRKRHASAGPDRSGPDRGHPYSLSAAPDGRGLRISVKDLGDGSAALPRVRPGTHVLVEGPYGRLSARARTRQKVALAAAGIGPTPLRALAEELDYAPGDAVLLYRSTDRPLFEGELAALARERGLQATWLPGHRRAPDSWLGDGVGGADDRTALTFRVPDIAERDVYVCGPEGWAEDVRRTTSAGRSPSRPLPCRELRMVTGVRRIVLWFMSTLTVVTLLFGYHTSTSPESATGATGVLASPADGASGTPSGSGTDGAASASSETVTGPSADTRWGPVQVQVMVDGGTITDVTVVDHPTENGKDRAINARAIPILVQETLDAQSNDIDMVSGATLTSEGYVESLQAALDEAGR